MGRINSKVTDKTGTSANHMQRKTVIDKRTRSLRVFSIGSVIVLAAILLTVNLFFDSALSDKLSWDLSSTQVNSIGDVSKGIVSKLDKDVEIVGLFERTNETEVTYKDFIPLLEDYEAQSNGRITVRYVDPAKYPSILTELDPNNTIEPAAGSFVIKCNNKLKIVNPGDCYIYDQTAYYSYGEYVVASTTIEYNFTGAITLLSSDTVSKVYFTTNHSEASHVQLTTLLNNNGFEVGDISTLSVAAIPDDCSLLIIDNPQNDISTDDVPMLTAYLERGGNLLVISDFASADLTFDHLNEVLHSMNLNLTNSLISENDMNYRIQATTGFASYADVPSGTFASVLSEKAILTANSRAVTVFNNPKAYITTEPVLTTSASAVLLDNGDENSTGSEGTYNIAVYSVNTGGTIASEAVVIGTTYLSSEEYISTYSLNDQNIAFFSSIVNFLCGTENNTQVPVKEYPNYGLSSAPSASTQGIWSVVLIAVAPMIFLGLGILIYNRRKNL